MAFDFKKLLMINPVSALLWGVFSKWYIMVVCASLIVIYWVYRGLDQAGVIQKAQTGMVQILTDSKNMAKYCVPLITSPSAVWQCAQNIAHYRNQAEENDPIVREMNQLEEHIKSNLPPDQDHPLVNRPPSPYDESQ